MSAAVQTIDGVNATTPDELKRAMNQAIDSGKPTLIRYGARR